MNSQKRLSAVLLLVFLCNLILPAAFVKADVLIPKVGQDTSTMFAGLLFTCPMKVFFKLNLKQTYEITSGQDKVFDLTLQALQAGNEIIFIDLIQ